MLLKQSQSPSTPPTTPAPAQLPSAPSSAVNDFFKIAGQTVETAGKVAAGAKLPAIPAAITAASLVASPKASVLQLDAAVSNLENNATGSLDLVQKTAKTFAAGATALQAIKGVPKDFEKVVETGKSSAEAFAKFAKAYEDYTKASVVGKIPAALEVRSSWKDFNTKFADFNKEADKAGLDKVKGLTKDPVGTAAGALGAIKGLFDKP